MKQIITLLTAILLLASIGCVNDRGDYDYRDITEFVAGEYTVSINGDSYPLDNENHIVLKANDLLHIDLNGDFSPEIDGEYHWMIFPADQPDNADHIFEQAREIASTKDFNQAFTEGPGKYILYFEAEDPVAKTKYHAQFQVEVLSIMGMLVYHTDEMGKGDYSAITTAEMFPELSIDNLGCNHNIYSSINGEKIENPTRIWVRTLPDAGKDKKILLSSINTMTTVNYNTHVKETDEYRSFFLLPIETEAHPEGHLNGFQKEFLVQNGNLHRLDPRSLNLTYGVSYGQYNCKYSPCMMSIPLNYETYEGGENIAYNMTLRKFEYDSDYMGMSDFMPSASPGSVDISNTQMDLLYMDKGVDNSINAIMKDGNKQLHYVCFNLTEDPFSGYTEATCSRNLNLSIHPEISETSLWAIASRADLAYFASGDKVFLLNHEKDAVTPLALDIPAGAEISVLKVLKDPDNTEYDNRILLIAYNMEGKGVLHQYSFNPLSGAIDASSKKAFDGFGKIIDMTLKK